MTGTHRSSGVCHSCLLGLPHYGRHLTWGGSEESDVLISFFTYCAAPSFCRQHRSPFHVARDTRNLWVGKVVDTPLSWRSVDTDGSRIFTSWLCVWARFESTVIQPHIEESERTLPSDSQWSTWVTEPILGKKKLKCSTSSCNYQVSALGSIDKYR